MRFGAFVPQGWRHDLVDVDKDRHWPVMTEVAKAIESNGYESAWVYDHFHTVPEPTQQVTYEAWTLMGALAAVTDTVRLGQMCTCNSYRPPSYLAKAAASIDVISGGRLEMGIGAGWYEHEYLGYGFDFPKPSVRIGQLSEAVEIMRRMWTEDEVHFNGEHYQLGGAICQPKPIQEPHIPLWIAGGGEQLTLKVAARYAAATNFGDDVDEFSHKSEVLRNHCSDVGTEYDDITRSTNFNIVCRQTEAEVEEVINEVEARLRRYVGDKAASAAAEYRAVSGTPEQVVDHLGKWAEAGLDYAIVYFPTVATDHTDLDLFASEVIPALR